MPYEGFAIHPMNTPSPLNLFGLAQLPKLSYFICATQRSGSNFLANALTLTHLAGKPQEHFLFWNYLARNIQPTAGLELENWRLPPISYMKKVFAQGTGDNGVFGVTVMWDQLESAVNLLQTFFAEPQHAVAGILAKIFPNLNYIYLSRRDKIRQAISWAKASQSNQWLETEKPVEDDKRFGKGDQRRSGTKTQGGITGNSNGHAANLKYDFDQIAQVHLWFVAAERAWEAYFRFASIQPYRVIYEDFVEAYEPTIRGILDYLKIPLPDHFTIRKSTLKKQSDALNEAWVQRYTTDLIERFYSRDEAFRNSLEAYARGNILPNTKLL